MKRKILLSIFSLFLVFTVISSIAVSANAASGDVTVSGSMQDTSSPNNGVVYWSYTYNDNLGEASLRLWGNGYMPNNTDDNWFSAQYEAGYYITKVTIEEGVRSIMSNAFAGEIYLEEVTLPSSIEFVGEGAFAYTAMDKFNIPVKMRDVDSNIFSGSPISEFTVSSSNPYYKAYKGNVYSKDMTELVMAAPYNYEGDEWHGFDFPASVTSIGRYAFMGCPIKSITIPSHIKSIKNMAFAGCSELEKVTLQKGVQEIYDSAFLACDSLKNIQLPSSVNYLGYCSLGYTYGYDYEALRTMLDYKGISYKAINEGNFEYYANLTGFGIDAFITCYSDDSFNLHATIGSAGENYAKNNGLKFVKASEFVAVRNGYDGVVLEWSPSHEVSHYVIYRKEGNTWRDINTRTGDFTTYLDSDIYDATDVSYAIEICYYSGYKYFDTGGLDIHYVPAPVLRSIGNNVGGVRVNWYSVIGAKYYYVYRKAPGENRWKYLKCVSGNVNTYLDTTTTSGENYSYTVRAYDGVSTSGYDPNGLNALYVESPVFKVYNNTSTIALMWNKVPAADSYRVYRKTGTGSWVLIKTLGGNSTYFADTTAKRGVTYTYTVRAGRNGVYSSFYPQGTAMKSIAAPMNLKLENRVSGVMVSWNKCEGADGYYVYRKTASGSWLRIATVKGNANLTYLDTAAKSGQNYTYTVKAFSGSYHSTYVLNGVSIKFLATPKISSVKSTSSGVNLKYNTVSGSQGYYIYRKTVGGTWSLVGTVKSGTTSTYVDKTAKKGVSYIYTVRAYNGSNRSSFYSNGNAVKVVY